MKKCPTCKIPLSTRYTTKGKEDFCARCERDPWGKVEVFAISKQLGKVDPGVGERYARFCDE